MLIKSSILFSVAFIVCLIKNIKEIMKKEVLTSSAIFFFSSKLFSYFFVIFANVSVSFFLKSKRYKSINSQTA